MPTTPTKNRKEYMKNYSKQYQKDKYKNSLEFREKKKERQERFKKKFKDEHGCSYGTFYCRELREEVLTLLGMKCVYCGCDAKELLEINHKELGVNRTKKRTESGSTAYYLKILSGEIPLKELETTCKVCNILHYCRKKFGDSRHKVIWR